MDTLFDPASREQDLIQLAALVFLPAAAALLLQAVPGRLRELLRWLALFAAGGTLALSLCVLVDFHRLLDSYSDRATRSLDHPATRLEARSDRQLADAALAVPRAFNSFDLLTRRPWLERFDIHFALGVDGASLALVIVTAFVTLLALAASATVKTNLRGFLSLVLLLESLLIGAFLACDLFLFLVFCEAATLPAFLLVGLWGGVRGKSAALKLALGHLISGACLAGAVAGLHAVDVRDFVPQPDDGAKDAAVHSFDPVTLGKAGRAVMLVLSGQESRLDARHAADPAEAEPRSPADDAVRLFAPGVDRAAAAERLKQQWICSTTAQYVLFGLLFAAFALKLGLPPLHSWLVDAVTEAPTAAGMVLAGAAVNLGGYGLYRFAVPLAPWANAELAPAAGILGILAVAAGAVLALRQADLTRALALMIAGQAGFVVVGLTAWPATGAGADAWVGGASGAVLLMVARGAFGAGLLFGAEALATRFGSREVGRMGGVLTAMPAFGPLLAVSWFAAAGAPGLAAFVGLSLIVGATFAHCPYLAAGAIIAAIVAAATLARIGCKLFFGPAPEGAAPADATARELTLLGLAALVPLVLGVVPGFVLLQWVEPGAQGWAENLARLRP